MRRLNSYYALFAVVFLLASGGAAAAKIEVQLPEHRPIPGEAAVLELHLHPDAGTIPLAPDLEAEKLPEGISLEWGTLEASDTPEGPVYTQLVTVTGASMGTFTLDGLAYTFITTPDDTPLAGEKLETEGKTVTVSIEPFEFEVVRDIRPFLWSGVAALGVALVLGLVAWAARRSRKPVEQAPGGTPAEQVQARLHQARQHRLDGDFYKVYLAFAEAAKILHPLVGEGPAPDALQRRAQEVGYKGVRPTDDEMDGVARDLERALARLKENV